MIESTPCFVKVEAVAAETTEEPMLKKNEEKVISSPNEQEKACINEIALELVKAP